MASARLQPRPLSKLQSVLRLAVAVLLAWFLVAGWAWTTPLASLGPRTQIPLPSLKAEEEISQRDARSPDLELHETTGKTLLLGILTIPGKTAIRSAIREAFNRNPPHVKQRCTLYFVMGKAQIESDIKIVESERQLYNDLLMLPMEENMNAGKTFAFFAAAEAVSPPHRFYMKADDDTFVHLPNLLDTLESFPSNAYVYYGRYCKGPRNSLFMCGMAYVLSANLFALIPRPPRQLVGHEDQLTNSWIREYADPKVNVTRFSDDRFYDYELAAINSGPWKRPFQPGNLTVVVHQLKSVGAYLEAVRFFLSAPTLPSIFA